MADWLTAEQRLALKHRYGTKGSKTPEEMAIEEACELSPEVRELWESKGDPYWSGSQDEYAQLLWSRVFRELQKLGFMEDVLAAEPETASSPKPRAEPQDDMSGEGITIPYALVEDAVQLHVKERLGRRTLGPRIAGLGEWGARAVLYWFKVGKPAGLWLDDHGRLFWGPAITPIWDREQGWEQRKQPIAPTPAALLLPRP
jgi:hypothetical protein